MTVLWVAGIGIVTPGLPNWAVAEAVLREAAPWQSDAAVLPAAAMLPKNERRRASPTIKLALEVAHQAITASAYAATELATVFGSSSGDGDVLHAILEVVVGAEPRVSPTLFHNSVHNAAAGYVNIATGCRMPSISIGAFDGTVAATLFAASVQARRGPVLAGVYDAALPPPLCGIRPIMVPFGAALVLAPERPRAPLARLAFEICHDGAADSALASAALAPLVPANPAARVLPLLEAIARQTPARVAVSWEGGPSLAITVTPC